jgi:hypothetical protein
MLVYMWGLSHIGKIGSVSVYVGLSHIGKVGSQGSTLPPI